MQDLLIQNEFGSIENEATAVRTNGADDGASGGFSYALTPVASKTAEGAAALISPWIYKWVPGGSAQTLTVHIANDGASDFNRDEVWAEFLTVSATDSPEHDLQAEDSGFAQTMLGGATAVTDDTGSTWGTGASNHQKFEHTVTPGFEGWAMVRVHYQKRFTASPDVLYVDPRIILS
jgi:hypothetical protein